LAVEKPRGLQGTNQYRRVALERFLADQRQRVQRSIDEHSRRVRRRLSSLADDADNEPDDRS